ncbi:MAG: CRISPR-associated endonuclease Cas1 [Treponema sp.]|nr:CRISPR-associated endonuclease Cas1 [Treponema sp.]
MDGIASEQKIQTLLERLQEAFWLECHVVLRNTYAQAAKEHPLLVFDALFKYASHVGNERWPAYLFRPDHHLPTTLCQGKRYGLTLCFPLCSDALIVENAMRDFRSWLTGSRTHFELVHNDPIVRWTVGDATEVLRDMLPPQIEYLQLDILSPRPFEAKNSPWKGTLTADWLGELLLRRAERLFGNLPEVLRKSQATYWKGMKVVPWFWDYASFPHISRSTGGTRFLNGFSGPLWLEGNLEPALPLLAICSHLNMGARLSAGQGAFAVRPAEAFLDRKLYDEETWFPSWYLLAQRVPGLCTDLPEGFYDHLCRERLETLCDGDWQPAGMKTDALLGMGIFHLLHKALRHINPELADEWHDALPLFPDKDSFLPSLLSAIPRSDICMMTLVERYALWMRKPLRTILKHVATPAKSVTTDDDVSHKPEQLTQPAVNAEATNEECLRPLRRPCYILTPGAAVTLDSGEVRARYQGKNCGHVPLGHVSMLILQGVGSVSVPLTRACAEMGIPVIFCTRYGRYRCMISVESAALRERWDAQLRHWDKLGESGRCRAGARVIMAKVQNYIFWLKMKLHADKAKELACACTKTLSQLSAAADQNTVLGLEGSFARLCYHAVSENLLPSGFHSYHRRPRLRPDRWNCLLDMASCLIFNRIVTLLYGEGLSPYRGFLHCQHARYATLAADMQEIFRSRTEEWLVTLLKKGIVETSHFTRSGASYLPTKELYTLLVDVFEQELCRKRNGDADTWLSLMEEQIHRLRLWCTGRTPLTLYCQRRWWQPDTY